MKALKRLLRLEPTEWEVLALKQQQLILSQQVDLMRAMNLVMDSLVQPGSSAPAKGLQPTRPPLHSLAEMLLDHLEQREDSPIVMSWMPGREQ